MNKIIAERYELIDIIGQGGIADVYLANDTILNRTIAIKILRTSLAKDPIYIARFQREASAAAALSHKNIVEISAYTPKASKISNYLREGLSIINYYLNLRRKIKKMQKNSRDYGNNIKY